MNRRQEQRDELAFLERVMRYQDGVLAPEEVGALEQEMRSSPERRRLFAETQVRAMSVHQWLRQDAYRVPEPMRFVSWWSRLRLRPLAPLAAGLMVAAIIAFVVLQPQAVASPAAVLRHALKAHAAALDRCYRVELRGERDRALPPRQESLLWTRGDRFWNQVQADGRTVAWGRDESGGVWFALSAKMGVRLAADEVPDGLERACELRSVQMETLLREVLADFRLRREPASADLDVIHAEPKPGHTPSRYGAALLELDARTHVLRRVVLHRVHQGRAIATVSFTLIESSLQDETSYKLEGHLDADGEIYDRQSARGKRGALINEFLRLVRVWPTTELRTNPMH